MKKMYKIYFSPTGLSENVANQIASVFNWNQTAIDLSRIPEENIYIKQDDLCVISMPCYAGRIPKIAAERLLTIRASNTPAIVCVTFGNRAYEDSLLELAELCEKIGFKVIAGGAVVTEHNIMHVYGTGRPDSSDQAEIKNFAKRVLEKVQRRDYSTPQLPGNHPYKEPMRKIAPVLVDEKNCVKCGLCAKKCPVNAISADGLHVDMNVCINCMCCISVCPRKSRKLPEKFVTDLISKMKPVCEKKKRNEFYYN